MATQVASDTTILLDGIFSSPRLYEPVLYKTLIGDVKGDETYTLPSGPSRCMDNEVTRGGPCTSTINIGYKSSIKFTIEE